MEHRGAMVVPTQFKSVGDFRGGLAQVEDENGKMGYIDLNGNYVWREE